MDNKKMKQWLNIHNKINIQIPNEIFEDFSTAEFISWKHRAFAYSYYYLTTYIYRNALYGRDKTEDYSQLSIISSLISKRSKVSYITKKNGLLETLNYVRTTNNFPIAFYSDNGIFEFTYYDEIKESLKSVLAKLSPNFTIREPIKAIKRYIDEEDDFTGTYYDFQSTHSIPVETFIQIINDVELGYTGLYIFAFLKMKCGQFEEGFKISNDDFAKSIGCASKRTISKYTIALEDKGFIHSRREVQGIKQFEKIYSM